jgi:hypothetical protein
MPVLELKGRSGPFELPEELQGDRLEDVAPIRHPEASAKPIALDATAGSALHAAAASRIIESENDGKCRSLAHVGRP